jgi:hypothetical protein
VSGRAWPAVTLLCFDALLLALLELFFLPLRFDGYLLPALGGAPFPITALLALLATPLQVHRAGRRSARRGAAAAPLVVWLTVVLGVGITGPAGDAVLLRDWRALLLIACGVLPSAVVLGTALGRSRRERL